LLQIGRLEDHADAPAEKQRLLGAVVGVLADGQAPRIGGETRFDAACESAMQMVPCQFVRPAAGAGREEAVRLPCTAT
jgi:hypothetical protein